MQAARQRSKCDPALQFPWASPATHIHRTERPGAAARCVPALAAAVARVDAAGGVAGGAQVRAGEVHPNLDPAALLGWCLRDVGSWRWQGQRFGSRGGRYGSGWQGGRHGCWKLLKGPATSCFCARTRCCNLERLKLPTALGLCSRPSSCRELRTRKARLANSDTFACRQWRCLCRWLRCGAWHGLGRRLSLPRRSPSCQQRQRSKQGRHQARGFPDCHRGRVRPLVGCRQHAGTSGSALVQTPAHSWRRRSGAGVFSCTGTDAEHPDLTIFCTHEAKQGG